MTKVNDKVENVQGTESTTAMEDVKVSAEELTVLFSENPISIGKETFNFKKLTKDNSKIQVQNVNGGKLQWFQLSDFNMVEGEGEIILNVKRKSTQIYSDIRVTIARYTAAERPNMKTLIIELVTANPDLGPTELAKKFDLPNPIYVSKIRKKMGLSAPKKVKAEAPVKAEKSAEAEAPKAEKKSAKKTAEKVAPETASA